MARRYRRDRRGRFAGGAAGSSSARKASATRAKARRAAAPAAFRESQARFAGAIAGAGVGMGASSALVLRSKSRDGYKIAAATLAGAYGGGAAGYQAVKATQAVKRRRVNDLARR